MTAYRADLPELPMRMRHLPIDERGFPVPWFVATINGKPDFRVVRENGRALAWNSKICWLCGGPMGVFKVCVIGPMCAFNRVTSEPPSHLECAEYAAKACPFLTRPLAVRNERAPLPEGSHIPGIGIMRNPGVALVWSTREMKPFKVHNGVLFRLGDPTSLSFWHKGRRATRDEIDESIESGLPGLREAAAKDGPRGIAMMNYYITLLEPLLPLRVPGDAHGSPNTDANPTA